MFDGPSARNQDRNVEVVVIDIGHHTESVVLKCSKGTLNLFWIVLNGGGDGGITR